MTTAEKMQAFVGDCVDLCHKAGVSDAPLRGLALLLPDLLDNGPATAQVAEHYGLQPTAEVKAALVALAKSKQRKEG